MLIGSHSIIYSTDPEGDREFLRDILKMPNVESGLSWLQIRATYRSQAFCKS